MVASKAKTTPRPTTAKAIRMRIILDNGFWRAESVMSREVRAYLIPFSYWDQLVIVTNIYTRVALASEKSCG